MPSMCLAASPCCVALGAGRGDTACCYGRRQCRVPGDPPHPPHPPGRPGVGERPAPCSLKPLPQGKEWGGVGGGHSSNSDTCAGSSQDVPGHAVQCPGQADTRAACRPRRPSGGRPAPPRLPPPALAPPLTQSVGSQFRSPVRLSAGGAPQGGALPASSPGSGADARAAPRPAPRAPALALGHAGRRSPSRGCSRRSCRRWCPRRERPRRRTGRPASLRRRLWGQGTRGAHSRAPQAGGRRRRDPGPPRSPVSLQRGLPGEGGPQPPRGLGHAVAVPHGRRRRLTRAARAGESGSLIPKPPASTSWGRSCVSSCPQGSGEGGAFLGGTSPT